MAIPVEDIAKVRAATDIGALIGEKTSLRKVGTRLVGLCPFHGEKTPSFSVNAEEGLYYCFGCQASGDAISFVVATEGCDFVEAVERLAARAGVTVRNDADPANEVQRGRRPALYEALRNAADFYHERLLRDPDAGRARQYLRSRGYDGDTVRRFRIGFAPAKWDELSRALRLPSEMGREAGLSFVNRQGRTQDTFRERIIFPIFDPGDRVIALGGRILPEELRQQRREAGPKYRNSPESLIYQKRSTLYGLNWAKAEMTTSNEAIVCEGYTDVIGFFLSDLPRAVATCGTALTEDHFRLLSRFAKRIVLCFDADRAGENAAARLYEWERRHELELAVAALPPGSDPADLARESPERLRDAVREARPFLAFVLERALNAEALTTPESRARAAQRAINVIAEHPSPLVRDEYLLEVADRTHHEFDRLRTLLEQAVQNPTERQAVPRVQAPSEHDDDQPPPLDEAGYEGAGPNVSAPEIRAGRDALALAIHRPAEVAGRFHQVLFEDPTQRRAFQALSEASELHDAIEQAGPVAGELLRRLAVTDGTDEINLDGILVELVRNATTTALGALDREARVATLKDDKKAYAAVANEMHLVKEELERLRDPVFQPGQPTAAVEAAQRLVAWLQRRESEP